MALKADNNQSALSIIVDGITSPVIGDVQVVKQMDGTPGSATMAVVGATGALAVVDAIDSVVAGTPAVHIAPASTFADLTSPAANQTVVAAVTSKTIRVLAMAVVAGSSATSVRFQSGTGTNISPLYQLAAYSGFVLPYGAASWMTTASGAALMATTTVGSTPVGVQLIYAVV